MTTRLCTVREHVRKLKERLDTPKHRQLAKEIGWKPRIRVKALRTSVGRRV